MNIRSSDRPAGDPVFMTNAERTRIVPVSASTSSGQACTPPCEDRSASMPSLRPQYGSMPDYCPPEQQRACHAYEQSVPAQYREMRPESRPVTIEFRQHDGVDGVAYWPPNVSAFVNSFELHLHLSTSISANDERVVVGFDRKRMLDDVRDAVNQSTANLASRKYQSTVEPVIEHACVYAVKVTAVDSGAPFTVVVLSHDHPVLNTVRTNTYPTRVFHTIPPNKSGSLSNVTRGSTQVFKSPYHNLLHHCTYIEPKSASRDTDGSETVYKIHKRSFLWAMAGTFPNFKETWNMRMNENPSDSWVHNISASYMNQFEQAAYQYTNEKLLIRPLIPRQHDEHPHRNKSSHHQCFNMLLIPVMSAHERKTGPWNSAPRGVATRYPISIELTVLGCLPSQISHDEWVNIYRGRNACDGKNGGAAVAPENLAPPFLFMELGTGDRARERHHKQAAQRLAQAKRARAMDAKSTGDVCELVK